MTAVLVTLI